MSFPFKFGSPSMHRAYGVLVASSYATVATYSKRYPISPQAPGQGGSRKIPAWVFVALGLQVDDSDVDTSGDVILDDQNLHRIEGTLVEILSGNSEDGRSIKYRLAVETLELAKVYVSESMQYRDWSIRVVRLVVLFLVGYDANFPARHVTSPIYLEFDSARRLLFVECCRFLSILYRIPERPSSTESLSLITEARVAFRNLWHRKSEAEEYHEWEFPEAIAEPDCLPKFIEILIEQGKIFLALNNSSAYQQCLQLAYRCFNLITSDVLLLLLFSGQIALLNSLLEPHRDGLPKLQHPDPMQDSRFIIVNSALQIRGAWKKYHIATDCIPKGKLHGAFIWNGHLYVIRSEFEEGHKLSMIAPKDIRRINISQPDKWRIVTQLPPLGGTNKDPLARSRTLWGLSMRVHKNELYLFLGHPNIHVFDLRTSKWRSLKTAYKGTTADGQAGLDPIWPWPRRICVQACIEFAQDRMFVFGGVNPRSGIGSNLFMELNLKTMKWRRLSGLPWLTESGNPSIPSPRRAGASWTSKDEEKVYIYSGGCDMRVQIHENRYGPKHPWMYDDLWSWDVAEEKWREEKMTGNIPGPRAHMGHVFSSKLNKFLVFGGVNQFCVSETMIGVPYADTFVYNPPESGSPSTLNGHPSRKPMGGFWQQIQTCGFPTYRADCQLLEDPDTGNIYLYGGEVRGEYVPTKTQTAVQRKKRAKLESAAAELLDTVPEAVRSALGLQDVDLRSVTHHCNDFWRLHIDVPGGGFESIDMEDEARTAPLGPWQRCFECRKVGFWKKCGGACNGRVFFCSVACQSKGWNEHKETHGCRKTGRFAGDNAKL